MEQLVTLLLGVVVVGYICHYIIQKLNKTTIKSTVDNRDYEVRDLPDKQDAANTLADISGKLTKLVEYVVTSDSDRDGVRQLKRNFKSRNIIENTPGGKYTAYSVNKGEQLALCLRDAKDDTFIELNLIIFVAIHEIAHVMTDEVGHTKKFWDNMRYLLEKGEKIGVYRPEDYSKTPKNYCGLEINSSPYHF
jgi:hypothetical protein|tara:strand:+ start:2990 stop:3565 length:576 start_codon:yes stop_codon:yes gene_type:complete